MANTNDPFGFRSLRSMGGGDDHPHGEYTIASGLAANIGYGDLVKLTGTGRNITVCAAGDTGSIGVFKGVRYTDAAGARVYKKNWATGTAATSTIALVDDNPNQEFICQADTCAEGDVGAMCDIVAGTPDAYGNSTAYAEGSATATSGKTLRILGLVKDPDNAYGAYAKIRVKIDEHALSGNVSGAGGV